ncbi:polysaccharide pyruvyl transferase family protein [Pseudomonas stutzeri]|nr:polysaccharide pyruvyl transferase family protein [Stutzerimonas stutzeri]
MPKSDTPTLLFGAFDRHNFGDLLFPHLVAALLPDRRLRFAGLAGRDLRPWGGHRVEPLAALAERWRGQPVDLLHVGGELLTCDAWEAAVMLLPRNRAPTTVARFDGKPLERLDWARQQLGLPDLAPYVAGRTLFPQARLLFNAVGGMDLDTRDAALRTEVLDKLRAADALGVRDLRTLRLLETAGIQARLLPDPAVLVRKLYAARIARHAALGEIARLRQTFPTGYLAVQFSAEFGDDASLATIAAQLEVAARAHRLGVVFFRAGAAPWHDDLDCYRRTAARMATPTRIVASLNLWDICALLAHSHGFLGSSLHGRIVATAYALPRLSLHGDAPGKAAAYAGTWEAADLPIGVAPGDIAQGLAAALGADRATLGRLAEQLVADYRLGFAAIRTGLS